MTDITHRWRTTSHLAALVTFLVIAPPFEPLLGQPDDERERAAATLEIGRAEAVRYVARAADGDQKPFTLNPDSVLKWHNTVDKNVHGNVFVWTKAGRPELVASIFQFYSQPVEFSAEFQSLSLGPLEIQKDGKTVWTPKEPGMTLTPFDDAGTPADSKPQRLLQMRRLAEQFSAELTTFTNKTYRMRLMPQPLYRYESTDPQVLDGALFAFTYTTDPDVLLLIEARQTDDAFRWMFGLGRMHVAALKVSHRDREVWNVNRLVPPFFYKDGIFTKFTELTLRTREDKTN